MFALDGLNARLLVDTEHHRTSVRLAVQLADHVDLLAKLRVGTVQSLAYAVRAHVAGVQDAL